MRDIQTSEFFAMISFGQFRRRFFYQALFSYGKSCISTEKNVSSQRKSKLFGKKASDPKVATVQKCDILSILPAKNRGTGPVEVASVARVIL